jgi:phage-related protein
MSDRPLVWVGSSLDDARAFPPEARRVAGYQLRRVQGGLMPTDWKPITTVGPGVNEIRIRTGGEHRVMYVARYAEAVYVLHAFRKKTRTTSVADLDLARRRLSDVLRLRRHGQEKK